MELLSVHVKSLDAPFGPSYDLECAENTTTQGPSEEIKTLLVRVEHFAVTDTFSPDPAFESLILQTDVNVTSAGPTVIQLNQVLQYSPEIFNFFKKLIKSVVIYPFH